MHAKVDYDRSPFLSALVGAVGYTVGVETANTINVACRLRNGNSKNIARRGQVRMYLAQDNLGAVLLPQQLMPTGGYAAGANGVIMPGPRYPTALYVKGVLAIDVTAQDFKTTQTAIYTINGVQYSKAATTTLPFTAAHAVSANKFGSVLVQVNAAGAVSTKVALTPQIYNTQAQAVAALPAPDALNVALGRIDIAAGGGGFTANTTALTGIATFVDAGENGWFGPRFDVVSNAAGQVDVTFSETGVRTFYLATMLPDGGVAVSGAITFA